MARLNANDVTNILNSIVGQTFFDLSELYNELMSITDNLFVHDGEDYTRCEYNSDKTKLNLYSEHENDDESWQIEYKTNQETDEVTVISVS